MTPPRSCRTIFTLVLGVGTILTGGLGTLFSLFALVLAVKSPYGNASTTALDIFILFLLPPSILLGGIGLLLRVRWARWWMILVMAGLMGVGLKGLIAPDIESPANSRRPGPAADYTNRPIFMISCAFTVVGGLGLLGLFAPAVRREFHPPSPPSPPSPLMDNHWRVGHTGRDMMYYEEMHGGEWRRIKIDGEMLTGRAHHVIYFANAERWRSYPEWARHRREEIITRIKSQFREPEYEYADGGAVPKPTAPVLPLAKPKLSSRDGTIVPMVVFLVVIAAVCFGFAARGLERGEARLPLKHNTASRVVSRSEKPVLFWTSLGILAAFGTGCAGFAAGLVLHRIRQSRPGTPTR
jgi:hypothetical protein